MNPINTTREVGEAIARALPSFETAKKWNVPDVTSKFYDQKSQEWLPRLFTKEEWEEYADEYVPPEGVMYPAPTLHETLIAIRELGKVRGWSIAGKHHIDESQRPALRCTVCDGKPHVGNGICSFNHKDEAKEHQHTLIDTLITADLDLSHPSVSEYIIRIFNGK